MEEAKKNDSVITFASYLKENEILTDSVEQRLNDEITKIINEATDFAENAAYAEAEDTLKYVYEEK